MATIDNEVKITINLSELVNIRSVVLDLDHDEFSLEDIEQVANELRTTLSWDTLYGMVDESILKYVDKLETHYGEISPPPGWEAKLNEIDKNKKQFEMVDLVAPAWTIQVPRRKV